MTGKVADLIVEILAATGTRRTFGVVGDRLSGIAGCTPQQIAPITGHSLKTVSTILDRYLARTRGLADQAICAFKNSP